MPKLPHLLTIALTSTCLGGWGPFEILTQKPNSYDAHWTLLSRGCNRHYQPELFSAIEDNDTRSILALLGYGVNPILRIETDSNNSSQTLNAIEWAVLKGRTSIAIQLINTHTISQNLRDELMQMSYLCVIDHPESQIYTTKNCIAIWKSLINSGPIKPQIIYTLILKSMVQNQAELACFWLDYAAKEELREILPEHTSQGHEIDPYMPLSLIEKLVQKWASCAEFKKEMQNGSTHPLTILLSYVDQGETTRNELLSFIYRSFAKRFGPLGRHEEHYEIATKYTLAAMKILLESEARYDIVNPETGNTLIFDTIVEDYPEIALFLLECNPVDLSTVDCANPLNRQGSPQNEPTQKETALYWAVYHGHVDLIFQLLLRGADPRYKQEIIKETPSLVWGLMGYKETERTKVYTIDELIRWMYGPTAKQQYLEIIDQIDVIQSVQKNNAFIIQCLVEEIRKRLQIIEKIDPDSKNPMLISMENLHKNPFHAYNEQLKEKIKSAQKSVTDALQTLIQSIESQKRNTSIFSTANPIVPSFIWDSIAEQLKNLDHVLVHFQATANNACLTLEQTKNSILIIINTLLRIVDFAFVEIHNELTDKKAKLQKSIDETKSMHK